MAGQQAASCGKLAIALSKASPVQLAARITPRVLAISIAAILLFAIAVHAYMSTDAGTRLIEVVSSVAAYGIAAALCLQIAEEYRARSGMRAAWICLAVFASVSIIRQLIDTPLWNRLFPGYWNSALNSTMREVVIAISLFFLALGVLTMVVTFYRLGIGFVLKWIDFIPIAAVWIIVAFIFSFRRELMTADLTSAVPRAAQYFSQAMFGVTVGGAILLMRLSEQMGGGQLANAMRCITAHIFIRTLLVLSGAIEAYFHLHLFTVHVFVGMTTPWIFAIAAALRRQVAVSAAKQASLCGIDPDVVKLSAHVSL